MPSANCPSDAAPRVSVCVVNWNSSGLLAELLESLEPEGRQNAIETIVVDNGSTDDSVEMVAKRFPSVRLIQNHENRGFSYANNQTAAVARGRHLLFLNNDTRVLPGAVAALARYLDDHPHVAAAGPKTFLGNGRYHCSCHRLPTRASLLHRLRLFRWTGLFARGAGRSKMAGMDPNAIQPVEQMDGAALMIRREALEACGSWDEGFTFGLEDVDLCARLASFGPLMYVPTAAIVHHGSVSQASNLAYTKRHFEFGYVRYLAKHGSRFAAPLYKLLVTLDQALNLPALIGYAVKWCDYKRRGRVDLIERSRRTMLAEWKFMVSLPRYWCARGPRRGHRAAAVRPADQGACAPGGA